MNDVIDLEAMEINNGSRFEFPCPTKLISQILIFQDDALEVQYKDHSVLQLSPCGANFKHTFCAKLAGPGNLKQKKTTMKRCEFATSDSRSKVTECLLIRNCLASKPCVPFEFLCKYGDMESLEMEKDITMDSWESVKIKANSKLLEDGSAVVESLKGYATLKLFPDLHKVKVTYLLNTNKRKKQNHVRIHQFFSAMCCPPHWKFPLSLAQDIITSDRHGRATTVVKHSATEFSECLPNLCPRQFMHKWREVVDYSIAINSKLEINESNATEELLLPESQNNLKIKYLWREGVSYWIYPNNVTKDYVVEAWLPDNSIIVSVGNTDVFYKHCFISESGEYKEATLSPATVVTPWSSTLKGILLRCNRLRMYCSEYRQELISTCWSYKSDNLLQLLNMQEDVCEKENVESVTVKYTNTVNDNSLHVHSENKIDMKTTNIRKALQGTQKAINDIDAIILQAKKTLSNSN